MTKREFCRATIDLAGKLSIVFPGLYAVSSLWIFPKALFDGIWYLALFGIPAFLASRGLLYIALSWSEQTYQRILIVAPLLGGLAFWAICLGIMASPQNTFPPWSSIPGILGPPSLEVVALGYGYVLTMSMLWQLRYRRRYDHRTTAAAR